MNERLTCFIHDTVDEVQAIKKHAEHQDKFMQTKCVHVNSEEVESMNEPKRTNKDVLLAVLPNVDTSACPKVLDMNYKCDKRKLCAVCKHEFWNADAHIDLRRLRNDSTYISCTDSCDDGDHH